MQAVPAKIKQPKVLKQEEIRFAETLDQAISKYLENARSPSRKVNEIDNRASTFYLAMYWAQALAEQDKDKSMQTIFGKAANSMTENEAVITAELLAAQGSPVNISGYYLPDADITEKAMRPSNTFNTIVKSI